MRKGQALVEFALVVVILFAVLFGIIDWGIYLYRQSIYNAVVSNAARQASILEWSDANEAGNIQTTKTLVIENTKKLIGEKSLQMSTYPIGNYVQVVYDSAANPGKLTVAISNYPYTAIAAVYSRVPKTQTAAAIIAVIAH